MKKSIFVSGLPRSMTTLLCNILANNPKIGGGETSPLLEYVYGARANYSNTPEVKSAKTADIMEKSFIEFCKGGIDAYANTYTDRPIFLDKSRGWLHYADLLHEINPEAKIIICVRDIRSIVSSLEKKWRQNPLILDARDVPAKQDFITIEQRVNHFLNDAPLGIALKRLQNAIETNSLKKAGIMVVLAEDLAFAPEEVMREVYDFIEEDYFEMDYSNVQQVTIENDRIGDFGIYGDHKIRKEIKHIAEDYDSVLGKQISQAIREAFGWFYNYFPRYKNKYSFFHHINK